MTETQVGAAFRYHSAADHASKLAPAGGRRRRAGVWLRAILNAQSLINGGAGGYDYVTVAEDDTRRMAGRRAR
jgi:hypothetical protein